MDSGHLFSTRPRLNSSHRNAGSASSSSGHLVLFEPPISASSRPPVHTLRNFPIASPLSGPNILSTSIPRSAPTRLSAHQSKPNSARHRVSRMSNSTSNAGLSGQTNPTTRTRGSSGRFESSVNPSTRACANCGKTDTPQWRTGVDGSSLCNPCGIKQRKPYSGPRSPGESATAAKKRLEVQRATASVASSKKKKHPKAGSSSSSPSARSSVSHIPGGASHSPPRSTADRAKKKRKEAYELSTLLNPQ